MLGPPRGNRTDEMADAFAMNSYLGKQILALVRDGDYAHAGEEEAIELARRAVNIEPENPAYLDTLGWALFKQGRVEEAAAPLDKAARSNTGRGSAIGATVARRRQGAG